MAALCDPFPEQNNFCQLSAHDWVCLNHGTVNEAVDYFMDELLASCEKYIPREWKVICKQSHPWLDDDCASAIQRKNEAQGTSDYGHARDACAATLQGSYQKHIVKLKNKIKALPKGSKQ